MPCGAPNRGCCPCNRHLALRGAGDRAWGGNFAGESAWGLALVINLWYNAIRCLEPRGNCGGYCDGWREEEGEDVVAGSGGLQ